jgi:hypothetical protein
MPLVGSLTPQTRPLTPEEQAAIDASKAAGRARKQR